MLKSISLQPLISNHSYLNHRYPVGSMPGRGGGARGQNLEHLVKAVFLCWSFLEVYIFATTYRKAFIVGPKVPYPTLPNPTLPLPYPYPYPTLPYLTLPLLTLPFQKVPYPTPPLPHPTHPTPPHPTPTRPTLLLPLPYTLPYPLPLLPTPSLTYPTLTYPTPPHPYPYASYPTLTYPYPSIPTSAVDTCCEHMQHINIEQALLGYDTRNGLIICNLIHRISG